MEFTCRKERARRSTSGEYTRKILYMRIGTFMKVLGRESEDFFKQTSLFLHLTGRLYLKAPDDYPYAAT